MIRVEDTETAHVRDTSVAHVEAVADAYGLPVVAAGGFYYCVARVPLFGRPTIYRCRVPDGEPAA